MLTGEASPPPTPSQARLDKSRSYTNILHHTKQNYIFHFIFYIILYSTLQYSTIQYNTILYYTILHYSILYYTIYKTTLYYTILGAPAAPIDGRGGRRRGVPRPPIFT